MMAASGTSLNSIPGVRSIFGGGQCDITNPSINMEQCKATLLHIEAIMGCSGQGDSQGCINGCLVGKIHDQPCVDRTAVVLSTAATKLIR